MPNARIEGIGDQVAAALEQLEPLFSEDAELTFVARGPGVEESEMVVTSDPDMDGVAAALRRHAAGS